MTDDLRGLAGFIYESGLLKRYKRTGWLIVGVKDPESVADHSFRTAVIGTLLATLEGADVARVSLLCLFHDSQESRITDIPHIGKRYIKASPNEDVTADQVKDIPQPAAEMMRSVVTEYEARKTLESKVARDADKLECLIQACEYREQGYQNVQPWIDTSLAALQTTSAKKLAEEALQTSSLEWLDKYLNGN